MVYISLRTGRIVPPEAVKRALDAALQNNAAAARDLASQLRAGAIGVDEWELMMRSIVKSTQLYSSAAARGGWATMDARAFGLVGQRVRTQYAFLAKRAEQIVNGLPLDGAFLQSTTLYAKAAGPAYIAARADVVGRNGFDEIATDLHPAEHCEECIAEAARGFVKVGTEVPIGQRTCGHNDRCTARFRNSRTGEEIAA